MFREYFILFLLGHILGDFYFQTKGMAEKKEKSIKWVLLHLMVYRPENKEEDITKDNNTGRFIGTVERIIMLIFLSISQYSAIG